MPTRIHPDTVDLYAAYSPCLQREPLPVEGLSSKRNSLYLTETIQSRGPWLASGLCCPAGSSLTMTSSEPLFPSHRLMYFRRVLAPRSAQGWEREGPQFTLRVFSLVPSSVPRWPDDCLRLLLHRPLWPSPSSQKVGVRLSTLAGSLPGLRNEAAKFASCYGPMRWLALLRQGRLLSSFHLLGHPSGASNMTTRANSQFPRPDFHRLDKQPYRLHAKAQRTQRKRIVISTEGRNLLRSLASARDDGPGPLGVLGVLARANSRFVVQSPSPASHQSLKT